MNEYADILHFWFGDDSDDVVVAGKQQALWWSKNPHTDTLIRTRFEPLVLAAEAGELDGWRATPEGLLALILLVDQFPRNIYRDTPDAFSFDPLARKLCLEALDTGADQQLRPIQRIFAYLPLEHSENLAHQQRCVELTTALALQVPEAWRTSFESFAGFAEKHRVIIERFGRFPHRNAILGRPSTDEELQFLQQPGSSF
jgi:uncharacterized protein (DUF924 family)